MPGQPRLLFDRPGTAGGTFLLASAITLGALAAHEPGPTPPQRLNATFMLGSTTGVPGGEVEVPFLIRANEGVAGYSFSVDFDEEVLQVMEAEMAWQKPDGSNYGFKIIDINNRNDFQGSAGVDEGFVVGAAVFSVRDPMPFLMPPDIDNVALRFHFIIDPDTEAASTEVRFQDGGQGPGEPVQNMLIIQAQSVLPEMANSFIFLNGRVNILVDIGTFIRGDSNGDGEVDISDAQTTLFYLFLGSERPYCFDAADFNDDGDLDVSDAVSTLEFLFLDGDPPQPPFFRAGEDPTEDPMSCLSRGTP